MSMTHDELVKRAAVWLRTRRKCPLIMTEAQADGSREKPDAIGWFAHVRSIVVECKTSRSDFKADAKKELHLGNERFYMTPARLVSVEEVKDPYGLVWVYPSGRIVIQKHAKLRDTDHRAEKSLLVAELRRVAGGFRRGWDEVGLFSCEGVEDERRVEGDEVLGDQVRTDEGAVPASVSSRQVRQRRGERV